MAGSDLHNDMANLVSILNSMTANLEATVKTAFNGMTPEGAIEFAKAMENAKVSDKLEELKSVSKELKKDLNIK